jgi:drug/metabolite transporter (DMT)-like permease
MLVSGIINVLLIVALSIYLKNDVLADLKKITFRDAVILVCLPIFTVFVANIIYYYILKKHESSLVSAITYSSPAFTLILAYLFLNERLDIYGLSGIFAIIAGVILISNNNSSYKILQLFTDSH